MADLVTVDDPDYAKYTGNDPEFFVKAAGEAIRGFCGWHISPVQTDTRVKRHLGERGKIILPTLRLVGVTRLTIDGVDLTPEVDFHWWQYGEIERTPPRYSRDGWCLVDFTHGYDELPFDIKTIVFEVASAAEEISAGNVKGVTTPGYSITYGGSGVTISDDQCKYLAGKYRIGGAV